MSEQPTGRLSADESLLFCSDFGEAARAAKHYAQWANHPVSWWPHEGGWAVEVRSAPAPAGRDVIEPEPDYLAEDRRRFMEEDFGAEDAPFTDSSTWRDTK